jgi:hypothetical protein
MATFQLIRQASSLVAGLSLLMFVTSVLMVCGG